MKKYRFFLKMVSSKGLQAHTVIGAHPSETIGELAKELNERDFIMVEEFSFSMEGQRLVPRGPLILSQRVVGKVKEYVEGPQGPRAGMDE